MSLLVSREILNIYTGLWVSNSNEYCQLTQPAHHKDRITGLMVAMADQVVRTMSKRYLNRNIRFMANHIRVDADPGSSGNSESPDIFQLHGQVIF